MIKYHEREKAIGWAAAILSIIVVTALQAYLASKLSLWADETSAIAPALRPWSGDKNFWWQIRQYIANPPGENLVLRLLYKCKSLSWLLDASPEFFWRIPYICVYALSALVTYFYSAKWSRSPLVGSLTLAFFLSSPGPFVWATEVRFYAWAILFMTCSVWEGMLFIESGFERKHFVRLSAIATVGVLFHISLALVVYCLLGYSVFTAVKLVKTWKPKNYQPSRSDLLILLKTTWLGVLPYLVYYYERRFWLWVPNGSVWRVLGKTLSEAVTVIPTHLGGLLPVAEFWTKAGLALLAVGLIVKIFLGLRLRNRTSVFTSLLLVALLIGGTFSVYLSAKANLFTMMSRYLLFAVPLVIASTTYLLFDTFREMIERIPILGRSIGIGLAILFAVSNSFSLAKQTLEYGSPSKVNYDLAKFRDFYSQLPDRRQLVLVGVGDKELSGATDADGWIGGMQTWYTEKFSPFYLNSRKIPDWSIPSSEQGWKNFDFLIFVPISKEPKIEGIHWDKLKCVSFSWGYLRFCRSI